MKEGESGMDARKIMQMQGGAVSELAGGLPVHPTTGLTALGLLPSGRPVWPVLGGAPDDDTDDETDDDKDREDDEDQDDDAEDDKPDPKADEGKDDGKGDTVSRAELNRAVRERQRAKQLLRDARKELADLKQANEGAEEKAVREARETADAEAGKKYKPLIIRTSARAELVAAGVKADKVNRLIKLLDLDEIEVDDDGEVSGLTDQVDTLKDEWPELFAAEEEKKGRRERRGSGSRAADGADKQPEKKKPMTASERQAAALLGK